MRKLLFSLLLGFLAVGAEAQINQKVATLAYKYDVDSNTLTYCKLVGKSGDVFGAPIDTTGLAKTTGSNTTVTEFTASSNPFSVVAIGDTIIFDVSGVATPRTVVAKASAASITVDSAITLTGAAGHRFTYRTLSCGTDAAAGWFPIDGYEGTVAVQYDQGDLDALGVRWECMAPAYGAQPVVVYPSSGVTSLATPGITGRTALYIPEPWAKCRVGVQYVTNDTSDAAANIEQVTITVMLVER